MAVLVVLALLGGAFVWLVASRQSSGDQDLFDLEVGDCFDDPVALSSSELVEVEAVESKDCDEPHDGEVYTLEDLPQGNDEPYPGDAAIAQQADEICYSSFEAYVGSSYEESALGYSYYLPSPDTWSAGDREVVCIVVDIDGAPLTGSVRGSGR